MKNTQIQTMNLAPEVSEALGQYNKSINAALEAVQKLESIAITARLAKMFGSQDSQTAQVIRQDYLVAA
ncbi:hypothetical protein GW846_02690 [Candidatus Gracilibacteria bacterium]|nr:hypothetical protein [Candidatus Gracilibacteria bacterium]